MPKLVNLGSLCIDQVYRVPDIANAGETVASVGHETHPGGKGLNQSLAAARAGAVVSHVGCIGADGDWLKSWLAEAGVDVGGVRTVQGGSGHAVIQVDATGQNAIVIVGAANRAVADTDLAFAFDRLDAGDWLLIQNEINDVERVLAEAARQQISVAFNVAPVDGREQGYDLSAVKLLIVNEIEAAALAGSADPEQALTIEPAQALAILGERLSGTDIVLTLGAKGLLYAGPGAAGTVAPFTVEAVDETAAGDAFIGYLMAGLLQGMALRDALEFGSAAGALAATQAGAASSIPDLQSVRELVGSTIPSR